MRQLVISYGRPAQVVDVPAPVPKQGQILVRTAYSAVSVGTERVAAGYGYMGIIGKAQSRPDQVKKVLQAVRRNGVRATLAQVRSGMQKWSPSGYSCSGIVSAVGPGAEEFHVGDRVACAGGGYAVHAEFCSIPKRLAVHVPEGVDLKHAAFAAIGSVAIHAFRLAEVGLCERVAVIGLGILGQLLCRIARAAGNDVGAFDIDPERLEAAGNRSGVSTVLIGTGEELEQGLGLSKSMGFDAVFLAAATPSSEPARLAVALARDRGRLVVVGDVGLHLNRQALYEKEISLRVSRSYGPGRYDPSYEVEGNDYPFGFVRWTEQRNMESFIDLLHRGSIEMDGIISHRFSIDEAARAFELIVKPAEQGRAPLGVVLEYPGETIPSPTIKIEPNKRKPDCKGQPGLALIGPGSFATSVLLPTFAEEGVNPIAIAGAGGLPAMDLGSRYSFEVATTDIADIMSNPRVDFVVIATRHGSHAQLVVQSLEAGKSVFVEKPLATTPEELDRICAAYSASQGSLMVGFNRRFAPFSVKAKSFIGPNHGPLMINMRVNPGPMPKNHWTLSPTEGGGRIIGEACHFIDLIQFFAGCPIVTVYAQAVPGACGDLEDTIGATFSLEDGSVATLSYAGFGDTALPKEYIEIFCDRKVVIIDDFRQIKTIHKGKMASEKSRQDKGFKDEVRAYLRHLRSESDCPAPFEQLLNSTLATFAVIDSCRSGSPVTIPRIVKSLS